MTTNCTVIVCKSDNHVVDILFDYRMITVPFDHSQDVYPIRAFITNGGKLKSITHSFRKRKTDVFVTAK